MKGASFLTTARLILSKDLRIEWRTWDTTVATAVFACIVVVVHHLALDLDRRADLAGGDVAAGVLWVSLAFASVVALVRSFQQERRHDALGVLFLAPVDRSAVFLGKAGANLLKLSGVGTLLLAWCVAGFGVPLARIPALVGAVVLHGVGLACLGTLFAAVATRVGRGEALLATLMFPALSPLLLAAVHTTRAAIAGDGFRGSEAWLGLAVGVDLLYLFVGMLTFEFVLEE